MHLISERLDVGDYDEAAVVIAHRKGKTEAALAHAVAGLLR